MMLFKKNPPRGMGIIEVILALALVSVVVVVIGRVLVSIQKIYRAGELKNEAYFYAQQPLEIVTGFKDDFFGCSCLTETGCTTSTCTRGSDGQICNLVEPYQSCWTTYPEGFSGVSYFYLTTSGGVWFLNELSGGALETVPENNNFQRRITITNEANLDGVSEDNIKKITVEVFWSDRGLAKNVSLSTILTAWGSF